MAKNGEDMSSGSESEENELSENGEEELNENEEKGDAEETNGKDNEDKPATWKDLVSFIRPTHVHFTINLLIFRV